MRPPGKKVGGTEKKMGLGARFQKVRGAEFSEGQGGGG